MASTNESFRPPIVSFAFASLFAIAAATVHRHPQLSGSEMTGVIMLGLTGAFSVFCMRAFDDWLKLRHAQRRRQAFKALAKQHGSARFADAEDIEEAELSATSGVFLGSFKDGRRWRDLRYDGDCSVNVVSPAGGSKSLAIAAMTLLLDLANSRFVNDITGELYCLTHEHVRRYHNVEVIAPLSESLSRDLGVPITDSGFNHFYDFDPNAAAHTIRSYVQRKIQAVLPRKGADQSDEKSNFFRLRGIDLLEFLCLYLIWKKCAPTLPAMRSLLMEGYEALKHRLDEVTESDAFGGSFRELANSLLSTMSASPEQFAGYLGVAENALSIYDVGSEMGRHCAKSFDPRVLKNDGRPTTTYIIYGAEYARTHQPALNLTISSLFDAVIRDPRPKRVTAIMDEIAACGRLDTLVSSLNTGRKHGLQIVSFWQDLLGGQAESIYGRAEMKQIIAAARVTAAFNTTSQETLELLSRMTGTVALESGSMTDRSQWNEVLPQGSFNRSHQNRPLLYPDEIRRMASDQMLIFAGNSPVIQATKVPFYSRPELKRICGRNPYHNENT